MPGYSKKQSARRPNGRLNTGKAIQSIDDEGLYPQMTEVQMQKHIHNYQVSGGSAAILRYNKFYYEWESDVLVIYGNEKVAEIEIKCSRADFFHDFTKVEKHDAFSKDLHPRPNQFYYSVPMGKKPMVSVQEVPDYAGLIGIKSNGDYKLLKSAPMQHNNKIDPADWKWLALENFSVLQFKQANQL